MHLAEGFEDSERARMSLLWDRNSLQLFLEAFHPHWLVQHKITDCIMLDEAFTKCVIYYRFFNKEKGHFCFDDGMYSYVFSHSKSLWRLILCIDIIIMGENKSQPGARFSLMQIQRAVRMLKITCEIPEHIKNIPQNLRGLLLFRLLAKDNWCIYRYFFSVDDVIFIEGIDTDLAKLPSAKPILKLANALLQQENHYVNVPQNIAAPDADKGHFARGHHSLPRSEGSEV